MTADDASDHALTASPSPDDATPAATASKQRLDAVLDAVRQTVVEVPGVAALGTRTQRRLASALGRVPRAEQSWTPGLNVEVGVDRAAVDLAVVAESDAPLPALGDAIRSRVTDAVRDQTGLTVIEVNVDVVDLRLPGEPEPGAEIETDAEVAADPADADTAVESGLRDLVESPEVDHLVITETTTTTTVVDSQTDDEQPPAQSAMTPETDDDAGSEDPTTYPSPDGDDEGRR